MSILLDDSLVTSFVTAPFREGWLPDARDVEIRPGLRAEDVGLDDVALLSIAESTRLTKTHLIEPRVAVVLDGTGPIAIRTPVRPDSVEDTSVRLLDAGPTAELATRALLKAYFGIVGTSFVSADSDEGADAQVVVVDGAEGLREPEAGHQEDLARAWFVLTGNALVSHVMVVGVELEARGSGNGVEVVIEAIATGVARRRDVRQALADAHNLERDRLAEFTNRIRYELGPDDRRSAANLVSRGGWGGRFGRTLPVFRDQLPASADASAT